MTFHSHKALSLLAILPTLPTWDWDLVLDFGLGDLRCSHLHGRLVYTSRHELTTPDTRTDTGRPVPSLVPDADKLRHLVDGVGGSSGEMKAATAQAGSES